MGLLGRLARALRPPELSVLFVCKANLCRSPMAQGMLQQQLDVRGLGSLVEVVSAGTEVSLSGRPADARAVRVLAEKGVNITGLRSRRLASRDFMKFDYVLALDSSVLKVLLKENPDPDHSGIKAALEFAKESESLDVPDPYFGVEAGFEVVYQRLLPAIEGLASELQLRLNQGR